MLTEIMQQIKAPSSAIGVIDDFLGRSDFKAYLNDLDVASLTMGDTETIGDENVQEIIATFSKVADGTVTAYEIILAIGVNNHLLYHYVNTWTGDDVRYVNPRPNVMLPDRTFLPPKDWKQSARATIIDFVDGGNAARLDRGYVDGLSVGDDLQIGRFDEFLPVGRARIKRVTAHGAVADITECTGGVRPEDLAYRCPKWP